MKSPATSQSVWIAIVFVLSFLFSTLTTAGCGAGAPECGPDTCSGCCMNGVCEEGKTDDICGAKGGFCFNCGVNACVAGSCQGEPVSLSGTPRPPSTPSTNNGTSTQTPGGNSGGDSVVNPEGTDTPSGGNGSNVPLTPEASWSRTSSSPSSRQGHTMVYDTSRNAMVLFGGYSRARLGDTFEKHSGFGWSQRLLDDVPDRRWGHAMAYDSDRQKMILFGGDAGDRRQDTWQYVIVSGNYVWQKLVWDTKPSDRKAHAMAYDSVRQNTVLFGGNVSGGVSNETWVYQPGWLLKSPTTAPPARQFHAMAFDSKRGELVLFGGASQNDTAMSDTWVWTGSTWIQRHPINSPPPRMRHAMAYDSKRGKVVLFGGTNGWEYSNQLWEWNGTDWTLVPASGNLPNGRADCAMAYDVANKKMVVTGGRNPANPDGLAESWEIQFN